MKIGEVLLWAKEGLGSLREAHYLLVEFLRRDLAFILSHADDPFPGSPAELFRWAIERSKGRPLAYLSGRKEFFGQFFIIDERALIPRPETELLVEKTIGWAHRRRIISIADVGTGSGCIAISLALALPEARIWALDSSAEALAVARRNVERFGLKNRIILKQSDLLSSLEERVDLIVANLPYLSPVLLKASPGLMFEPRCALLGGATGVELAERLLNEGKAGLEKGGALFLEIGDEQAELQHLARRNFPLAEIDILKDWSGLPRLLRVLIPPALF